MWETRHHRFANRVIKRIARPILFSKNHFKSKVYKLEKGKSYIILSNHQTTWDPILLYCSFKNLIYPVMAKDFIPHKLRPFVYKYIGPVLKAKTLKDIGAVKNMLQIIKEGGTIYLYPEGNRTFSGDLCYIGESTIKFIQKAKADLVFYNFHGGYGFDPRFSKDTRKGKFYGEVRKIVTHEEVINMSYDELYQLVIENLTVVEAPSQNEYQSSSRAEFLERALYRCPICGEISTLHSKGNTISCSKCNLEVEYLPNLTFKSDNKAFKHDTVGKWFKEQEEWIRSYEYKDDEIIFEDKNVILDLIHSESDDERITEGDLSLTDKEIRVGDKFYKYEEIRDMTVSGKQTLIFYIGTDSYRISAPWDGFNCIKYMQMYYHITHLKLNQKDDFLGI